MEKIISGDGTPIAYHRRGAGSPLVLVHGTAAANAVAWTAVLPALEEHFCIYAVDRRGRGESGDGSAYALDRESEDIAIDRALPNSRIGVMPGQQYLAMYTAPDLFLREVLTFLVEPDNVYAHMPESGGI
jgi:alpha-beta hydrolase superfamily lysophospholipase